MEEKKYGVAISAKEGFEFGLGAFPIMDEQLKSLMN